MDNACVIGYGVVGSATAKVFGIEKIYTRDPKESNITLSEASKCKFIFICLPTPVTERGVYKLEDIRRIIRKIALYGNKNIFIIRSTVYPGFANDLRKSLPWIKIISNPEFLSEKTALEDTRNPPFVVIGGREKKAIIAVVGLYNLVIKAPVIITNNITAEMAKIAMNAYFATKVIFANDVYDSCTKIGSHYGTVKEILEMHPYGPKNHFAVFFRGKRGVRGHCLPKDSLAYVHYLKSKFMTAVVLLNNLLLKKYP